MPYDTATALDAMDSDGYSIITHDTVDDTDNDVYGVYYDVHE